ncbi:16S rRNA (uracil(1498)-N(3))-methyltransferase [Pseudoxanthomonas wuyuanensis]|uniref:Ribosomal RNA small subunit methyltransferase E n=1 Tax=Pseudoxanthomonas wuyuanensis TaxID=1073196 RepID=A0A286D7T6_9GAMM|nr:16S rRNA (uracil(1498)-N(3))-methyltransferase [Pseudoxanthomonas wuyuanensis]KAF1720360.1 16S rRNA (uracil(1498)-N(3))-methyltransferase [Pseudoxanthomonas wuyuanensis]SOD54715.1 16S rRNA (uracil1498-N3)-methyltransferase [Pseudoxanthomonas wuyuanensis]
MRMTRCHVELSLTPGATVTLPESAAGHLTRVLRLREGDECVLFNGDGHDYAARIVAAGKRETLAEVLNATPVENESPLRIALVQGVARGEKMDLILQKATELGVAAFVPVIAERTEVKLDAERAQKRLAHWRSVVVAACEQSGRAVVPPVAPASALAQLGGQIDAESLRLTLDPSGEFALSTLPAPAAMALTIAIGPEGGWSPRDRSVLQSMGFSGLRLGPRVLRTETAGLAAIAALQSRFGDF